MRKYLFISGIFLFALLTACVAPVPEQNLPEAPAAGDDTHIAQPAPAPPVFQLDELPALAAYAPPREIIRRYADAEFVDTLPAADDYGRLYPYEGKIIGSEEDLWAIDYRYGLADSQGRIVVDAVYQYAGYIYDNPDYLYLVYPMNRNDEQAVAISEASYWTRQPRSFVFASADGSWVSGEYFGDSASLYEDRIVVVDYSEYYHEEDYWYSRNVRYKLYDLEGRLLAENDGYLLGFREGLGLVHLAVDDEQDYWYYIDKQGRTVIPGPFINAWYFENGRAEVTVAGEDGSYLEAYIDLEGNFISEPMPELPGCEYSSNSDWHVEAYFSNMVTPFNPEGGLHRGLAFTRGEITHYVGYEDFVTLDYAYISGDLFALSYYRPLPGSHKRLRLDFYDAAAGKVVKSLDGFSYIQTLNNSLLVLRQSSYDDYENNRFSALNLDFTPAFGLAADIFTGINYVADDVYAVHTALYSGLIRQNGEWLLRVNINTVD